MKNLLNGVRILDVSVYSPVRFGTTVLADLGADVIQIDKPPRAQRTELEMLDSTEHPRWLWHGRNKRSMVIDLKRPDGRNVFYDLLDTADAVVEGFGVGVAARLGIDYETLRLRKPDIVYASVSGYGQSGNYSRLDGHEQNYQAMSGLTAASGGGGRAPDITPLPISDTVASLYSVIAVLSALRRRQTTGQGAYLDISVQDAVLSLFGYNANYLWRQGITEPRTIREFGGHPGVGVYRTADDRAIQLSTVEPWTWSTFCTAVGAEDVAADYTINEARAEQIRGRLATIFAKRTRDEWIAFNAELNLGISPVLDLAELVDDPHVRDRGMVNEVQHPTLGLIEQLATPIAVDGSVPSSDWIPQPGDHTDTLLTELGYPNEQVARLRRIGAVSGPELSERSRT
ncbi:CaiB/BaiF CoA transferase family protein [Sciscionella marina]|uniref:CaiB/BaiF CoA transferase family protein n=1 Tax=Sciscionella marina TaxID=508770 RepID=UPI00035C6657|nr:CaiB/BaiF CoA-transferase family protein [Sciscionella marina]